MDRGETILFQLMRLMCVCVCVIFNWKSDIIDMFLQEDENSAYSSVIFRYCSEQKKNMFEGRVQFLNLIFYNSHPLEIMMRAMGTGSLPLINPSMSATDAQIAEESMFWVRNLADWFLSIWMIMSPY